MIRAELGDSVRVFWFGSWVNGTAVEHSDVDIGLLSSEPIQALQMDRILAKIEELPTLRRIDLIDVSQASEAMRQRVLAGGREL